MRWIAFFIGAMALSLGGQAYADRLAVGVGVGTAGAEAQLAFKVNDFIALRGSGNFLDYDAEEIEGEDVVYDAKLDATTVGAFVDLRPFKNAFVVTGGAFFGDRSVTLNAVPTGSIDLGDTTYTASEVGTLTGSVGLGDTAPYVGFGFDSTFPGRGSGVGFRATVGAAFGDPSVSLDASGSLASNPDFQTDLRAEEEQVEEDADGLEIYPIVSLGLNFRF
jgi:hypothetical protein